MKSQRYGLKNQIWGFIAEYSLQGYTILSCERENSICGVILYTNSLKAVTIADVDNVFIEIKKKSCHIITGLIYTPLVQPADTD